MERFAFDQQIARMAEKNLLYEVVKAFCDPRIDLTFPGLTPAQANIQMGYVFEELIRISSRGRCTANRVWRALRMPTWNSCRPFGS